MKFYRKKRNPVYWSYEPNCYDGQCWEMEKGYVNALQDAFLPVWELLSFKDWISDRDLINRYLDFLSKDEEARKDWPETGSFVKLALRQFNMNNMIKEKEE